MLVNRMLRKASGWRAGPTQARQEPGLQIFMLLFPLPNVWNKIQMNQLFQGQRFNYIPASFSADKNVNSLLTQCCLPGSLPLQLRGATSLCPGDHYDTASSSQPPSPSLCKEPRSQAEGCSSIKSLGPRGQKLSPSFMD